MRGHFSPSSLRPHICVIEATAAQSLASGLYTQLQFGASPIDRGGLADLDNDQILVKRGGVYRISARVILSANITLSVLAVQFGNPLGDLKTLSGVYQSTSSDNVYVGSMLASLQPGDAVIALCFTNDTTSPSTDYIAGISVSALEVEEIR